MFRSRLLLAATLVALIGVAPLATDQTPSAAAPPTPTSDVAFFDPTQGIWHVGSRTTATTSFYFGNPGDYPIVGDWDCDGIDTPGLYRQSDGYVYLRNSNTQGTANIKFYFGNPGDIPLAGDFDGDGCDSVSIYRPSEQRIYVINKLGSNDGGLGASDYSYMFGNPGDKPFVGDFNGDNIDTVGLHRESTGFVYYRNINSTGNAHHEFFFGNPGDRIFAGDWNGTGSDSPGIFRPSTRTVHLRFSNTQGSANESYVWGQSHYLPLAGAFGGLPTGGGTCSILPANNIWNRRVDTLPVHPLSAQYINSIGSSRTLHADFGSGNWPPVNGGPIGIPFVEVQPWQPKVRIQYTDYGSESDPGPFPIPPNAPIEGGPNAGGDRHVIVLDRSACVLYELFNAFPNTDDSWRASSGAKYDLRSNALRPDSWTSADAAGLPIYPGLVLYDEVKSGRISHAIRFTAPQTQKAHVWPARHHASNQTSQSYPPMGQRFRLKQSYDISGYPKDVQVILRAFKEYGLILADNGSPWYISGAPDERWNNTVLHAWDDIPGSAFEAVDVSGLMIDPNSGAAVP